MEVPPQNLSHITEQQWTDISKRLRLFTYKKYGYLLRIIGRLDLEAVIQDTILDTFLGVRRWPPVDAQGRVKNMSLFYFLCQTVRSKVSHIIEHEKKMTSLNENSENNMQELLLKAHSFLVYRLQGSDEQASYNELCKLIYNAVRGDALLTRIVTLLINTPDLQPKDIAKQLDLSEVEVRNALKRLTRRVKKMLEARNSFAQVAVAHKSFEQERTKFSGGIH